MPDGKLVGLAHGGSALATARWAFPDVLPPGRQKGRWTASTVNGADFGYTVAQSTRSAPSERAGAEGDALGPAHSCARWRRVGLLGGPKA